MYESLYKNLDIIEEERDMDKLTGVREKKNMNVGNIRCIKSEDIRGLIKNDEIKERWKTFTNYIMETLLER